MTQVPYKRDPWEKYERNTTNQETGGLYVAIPGIPQPVRPQPVGSVSMLALQVLAQDNLERPAPTASYIKSDPLRRYSFMLGADETIIYDTRRIARLAYELKLAANDGFQSLAAGQPLVKAGKVSTETMRNILGEFNADVWKRNSLRGELLDAKPWLRVFGRDGKYAYMELPGGKNAFLYAAPAIWRVNSDYRDGLPGCEGICISRRPEYNENYDIDVSEINPDDLIPVNAPEELAGATGLADAFPVIDCWGSLDDIERGLHCVTLVFRQNKVDIHTSPAAYYEEHVGTIATSTLSVDEIVQNFRPIRIPASEILQEEQCADSSATLQAGQSVIATPAPSRSNNPLDRLPWKRRPAKQ